MNMEDPEERAMRVMRNSDLPRRIVPLGPNRKHTYRMVKDGKTLKYVIYGSKEDCDEDFKRYKEWIKTIK